MFSKIFKQNKLDNVFGNKLFIENCSEFEDQTLSSNVYRTNISKILHCKSWNGNRNINDDRVNEIVDRFLSGQYITREIRCYLSEDDIFCYDGNHRRTAFKRLFIENNIDVDITLFILNSSNIEDVQNCFCSINQGVPVPQQNLLFGDTNIDNIKPEIVKIVSSYRNKYKDFISTSQRCQRPNFERDTFEEEIFEMINRFDLSPQKAHELLEKLNECYSKQIFCNHSGLPQKVLEKCKKYNFWLFCNGRSLNLDHIKSLIDN
jgi:hypothetical protein